MTVEPPGLMACSVCGWWPPVVRVRHGQTERAPDAWRWRKLRRHVEEASADEADDGNDAGPHTTLEREMEERREATR